MIAVHVRQRAGAGLDRPSAPWAGSSCPARSSRGAVTLRWGAGRLPQVRTAGPTRSSLVVSVVCSVHCGRAAALAHDSAATGSRQREVNGTSSCCTGPRLAHDSAKSMDRVVAELGQRRSRANSTQRQLAQRPPASPAERRSSPRRRLAAAVSRARCGHRRAEHTRGVRSMGRDAAARPHSEAGRCGRRAAAEQQQGGRAPRGDSRPGRAPLARPAFATTTR